MERTKNLFLIDVFILTAQPASSQLNNDLLFSCFLSWNRKEWKKEINQIITVHSLNDSDAIKLVSYEYGYIGYLFGANKIVATESSVCRP